MTKIDGRTKESAKTQLEESLTRLKTDRIDLVQFHEISRYDDPDRLFTEEGAIEALVEAKKAGKVRYIGFTGHKDPRIHLYMLDVAKARGFVFDTMQMPLNVMDAHYRSFSHLVVPELVKQNIGVLAMKTMGDGVFLKKRCADHADRMLALRDEPARIRRHYGYRQRENLGSSLRGSTNVQTDDR
jgi:uncharacterized protein